MAPALAPSSNFIWGGYRPRRVWSGWGGEVRQSFGLARAGLGIGGGDLVGRGRRAGLGRCKGMLSSPAISGMADFCGFRALARCIVTGSPVTGSQEMAVFRAVRAARRLIADYASAAFAAIEAGAADRGAAAEPRGGRPPFAAWRSSTPLAHSAAGLREKFRARPDRPFPTLSASPERANTTRDDGVGVRVAPTLPRTGRNDTKKTGPGAGERAEPILAARGETLAECDGAGAAMMQGGRPVDAKGAAMLCAPDCRVN